MRKIGVVLALFLWPAAVSAQISCSPLVPPKTCAALAWADSLFDHGILKNRAIALEIVTPEEYEKRMAKVQDDALKAAFDEGANARMNSLPP